MGGDSNLYGYVLGDPVNWIDTSGLYIASQTVDVFVGIGNGIISFGGDVFHAYDLALDASGLTGTVADQIKARAILDATGVVISELATNADLRKAVGKAAGNRLGCDATARGAAISRTMMGTVFSPLGVAATIGAVAGAIEAGAGKQRAVEAVVFGNE
jgi:uncharacterized protein RhaS with RHS repeats